MPLTTNERSYNNGSTQNYRIHENQSVAGAMVSELSSPNTIWNMKTETLLTTKTTIVKWYRRHVQPYQPCVQIDDIMLADVSGDEVEAYLLEEGIVVPNEAETDVPTDQACEDHGPSPVSIGFPSR